MLFAPIPGLTDRRNSSWLKATGIQLGQASRQNREQQRIRELEAEVRTLRKQLGEKEEVIDVLKKSAGIL